MSNNLEDLEKSMALAERINEMKLPLLLIDVDYATECVKKMMDHANFIDNGAALNPLYNPTKSDIYREQAKSLKLLVDFINSLKKVDELKAKLKEESSMQASIMRMFQ